MVNEEGISREEALALLKPERRAELRERAHATTLACVEKRFDFCSIINARSGGCTEDCKWCAQSARWKTGCETYGWVGAKACVEAARAAEANGADRIGIVTSGRRLSPGDVEKVCEALREMRKATDIGLCGSLGLLSEEDLVRFKAAGLQRVHCNIETAPSLFPSLCSTHATGDKLKTIRAAKRLGFQICCGGIIGMGESDEQLVEFAFALKEIAPDSIPVNVLHPVEGTPLGNNGIPDPERVIDSVAILRLVNPSTPLRFAGGRRDMSDETAAKCVYVGMSAGIAGPLLTTPGADFDDDRELAVRAGYAVGGGSAAKLERLRAALREAGSAVVAFSAGVDSTFLLRVAKDELGDRVVAATISSRAIPAREIAEAAEFCHAEKIRHEIVDIDELAVPGFAENTPERCYFCKKAVFGRILEIAKKNGIGNVLEGSNLDDDRDWRPGRRAIAELGIGSPLRDARLTKAEIRQLSKRLGLATAGKPSFACLASRFPYGERITAAGLERVEKAERWLLGAGFGLSQLRVRSHGNMARIEVPTPDIPRLAAKAGEIAVALERLGFAYVSLDLRGYRSGSMNETL